MTIRDNGSYIGYNRVTSTSLNSASGIWSLAAAERRIRAEAWPTRDQYFSNVSLLLHMDGSSATFTDSSPSPKTITAFGSVTQSTEQSKFGGKSASFPNDSSYLSIADSEDFDLSADFVIEAWVYLTAYSQSYSGSYGAAVAAQYRGLAGESGGADVGWQLRVNGTESSYTTINLYTGLSDLNWTGLSIGLNTWHYIAVSRSGSTIRAYLNGASAGASVTNSDSLTESEFGDRPLFVGRLNDATFKFPLPGYIDELRITKGTDRGYTGATIAVPTSAFPDG